jgi:hypothetical protein
MKTTSFIPFWSTGKDSFLKDLRNADISSVRGDKLRQVIVVLQAPELKSDNLTYTVKVLQGEMPAKGAAGSTCFVLGSSSRSRFTS